MLNKFHIYYFSDEIRKLRGVIDSSTSQLELTKALAKDAKEKVDEAHIEALNTYTDISALHIPEIDIPKIKSDAEKIAIEVSI